MSVSEVKPGTRLRSAVSEVEVVVVRSPSTAVEICCGGVGLVALEATDPVGVTSDDEGTLLGKRYVDEQTGLEMLCTKGGVGALTVDGRTLTVKGAKPLPSSD